MIPNKFLNKHLFMAEIYITYVLQILSFYGHFRQFEMTNDHAGRQYFRTGSLSQSVFYLSAPHLIVYLEFKLRFF